jgi:hypothetical protein
VAKRGKTRGFLDVAGGKTTQTLAEWYESLLWEMRQEMIEARRNRINPRVIKRKMSKWMKKRTWTSKPSAVEEKLCRVSGYEYLNGIAFKQRHGGLNGRGFHFSLQGILPYSAAQDAIAAMHAGTGPTSYLRASWSWTRSPRQLAVATGW